MSQYDRHPFAQLPDQTTNPRTHNALPLGYEYGPSLGQRLPQSTSYSTEDNHFAATGLPYHLGLVPQSNPLSYSTTPSPSGPATVSSLTPAPMAGPLSGMESRPHDLRNASTTLPTYLTVSMPSYNATVPSVAVIEPSPYPNVIYCNVPGRLSTSASLSNPDYGSAGYAQPWTSTPITSQQRPLPEYSHYSGAAQTQPYQHSEAPTPLLHVDLISPPHLPPPPTNTNSSVNVSVVSLSTKKRMQWTEELHDSFLRAVTKLKDRALPMSILREMQKRDANVEGVRSLTREQVASHLQKHRGRQQSVQAKIAEVAPISSMSQHSITITSSSCTTPSPPSPAATTKAVDIVAKDSDVPHSTASTQMAHVGDEIPAQSTRSIQPIATQTPRVIYVPVPVEQMPANEKYPTRSGWKSRTDPKGPYDVMYVAPPPVPELRDDPTQRTPSVVPQSMPPMVPQSHVPFQPMWFKRHPHM